MNPKRIDRYEIQRELGRGGMATVYLAQDPRFGRDVAVKMLPRDLAGDESFRARFEHEARIVASLQHPAIVPVHDYGEQDGQLYIVMSYMPGGSLADRLARGPLMPERAAEVLRRVAGALDVAHRRGIVHRDVKPANILFDSAGNAYLADFGTARWADLADAETMTRLTQHGQIIGTPAYMSPEQVHGHRNLDGRTDIYSLGIVLYEMLCGSLPFNADTPMQLAMKHVLDPVPDVRAERSDLPAGIETVVDRALAKEADARFATAGEMAEAMAAAVRGHAIPPPAWEDERTVLDRPTPPAGTAAQADASADRKSGMPTWAYAVLGGAVALIIIVLLAVAAVFGTRAARRVAGENAHLPPIVPPSVATTGSPGDGIGDGDGDTEQITASGEATPTPSPTGAVEPLLPTASTTPSPTPTEEPTEIPSPTPELASNLIAFVSDAGGRDGLYIMDPSRPQEAQPITQPSAGERHWWPSWCQNSRLLFEYGNDPYAPEQQEIGIVALESRNVSWLTSPDFPPNSQMSGFPSCSPDGNVVAFSTLFRNAAASNDFRIGLVTLDEQPRRFRQLGDGYALAGDVSWSADSQAVVFMHYRTSDRNFQIYRVNLDAPDTFDNLTSTFDGNAKYPDWSAVRDEIAFACNVNTGDVRRWSLCTTPASHSDVRELLPDLHFGGERDEDAGDIFHAVTPSWSPDGLWIAYASNQDGDWDIYRYDVTTGDVENLTDHMPSDEMHPSWGP